VYATSSKADAGDPIGIAGLRAVAAACSLPVAAIGGITLAVLPDVRETGVAMAAVISAISAASDPREATAALVRAWTGG
jgi:thiamine monophosphate synthase